MAIDYPALPDFDLANFTGCVPDPSGAVTLTPNNRVPDQYLRELTMDGSPSGWERVSGPTADGYHAYLFKTDGGVRTGGRQTQSPDTNELAAHVFNTPLASGGLAPTSETPGIVMPAQPLEAPEVDVAQGTVVGFQQGTYLAAISFVSKTGQHTQISDTGMVTINTDGKLLEFHLLLDADKTLVGGQGIWLSAPVAIGQTPDPNTMRLQAVAPNVGRTYILQGPYNYSGRTAPTTNETAIGVPPTLTSPRDFKIVASSSKWMAPGRYRFYQVQVNAIGESLPSLPSAIVEVPEWTQQQIVFNPRLVPGAIGFRIFWRDYYESSVPPLYQLVSTTAADIGRYMRPGEKPIFYGIADTGTLAEGDPGPQYGGWHSFSASATTNYITVSGASFARGQEVRFQGSSLPSGLVANRSYYVGGPTGGSTFPVGAYRGAPYAVDIGSGSGQISAYTYVKPPETYEFIGIPGDVLSEDASGIAKPSGGIDDPLPIGMGIPQAGTYLVGYTRVLGGRETPVSAFTTKTLSSADVVAGKVLRMKYPPRVNKIPNALYGQLDQKGLPLSWLFKNSSNATITAPDANAGFEKAGVFYLQTSGTIVADSNFPNAQTATDEEIAVDPARVETVAGWLEVTGYTGGTGYIELVQLDAAKAEVGTPLSLATLSSTGAIYFEKTLAGASVGGTDLTLNDATAYLRVRWGASGANRNLRVKAHSLIWAPQSGISRRYLPHPNPQEIWQATTDPAAPYPNSHLLTIGQPPPTSGSAAGAPTPPPVQTSLEVVDFNSAADGALVSPHAGWTKTTSGTPVDTIGAAYDLEPGTGGKGWRIADNSSSAQETVYLQKNLATAHSTVATAKSYAVRYHRKEIDTTDYTAYQFEIYDSGVSRRLLGLRRDNNTLQYQIGTGGWTNVTTLTTAQYDVEVIVTDYDTTTPHVKINVGIDNATPVTYVDKEVTVTADDYMLVRIGFTGYVSGGAVTEAYLDRIVVTLEGEAAAPVAEPAPPSLVPLVQPDWPWLAGTVLNGPSASPVDYTYTTANNATLAVAATYSRSGAIAAERTLAQIRTSAGTEVVGLYMKTDHTVELRRGSNLYQASAAMPTSTDYRFDVVVLGAGSASGTALVYRTIGTGTRELIVLAPNLDLTTLQAQRATVANNTDLTETTITVTERGEYVYDNVGPDGALMNQGYVSILPLDVTSDSQDVGFVVDEFIVKPSEERTFAVHMHPEDLPDDGAPFTVVAYDSRGRSLELGSAYRDGTEEVNASPGWAEYWMTYTPPEGYSRIRIEHRGMTGGRYAFIKALDAPGNLNTTGLRNAARDDRRALTGTYTTILNARIPATSETMMKNAYQETRTSLAVPADQPQTEEALTFTADAGTDLLTPSTTTHRWQTGSAVRLNSSEDPPTLPAPLAVETTYYIRDIAADGSTFKLAATSGGTAINISSAGTGTHTITGYTGVSARWRVSDDYDSLSSQPWQSDEALTPDLEWTEAEVTLVGDGMLTPTVPPGSPRVAYTTFMPMLLKDDRSPLPGGVYIGGGGHERNLYRPYRRSAYDTETVGDRAAPRSITDAVNRLWSFTLNVFHPAALDYIYSNDFLDRPHVIESRYHDYILKVQFYEPPEEPEPMFEYEGFDEGSPFAVSQMMPLVVAVERAEVLEAAPLSGEAPGD